MFRPWHDKSCKIHIGAGLIAMQSALHHQVVTKLAEPESVPIVSEMRSREHAEPYIGVARTVAVAVLQAEANHPKNHESMKSSIGPQRRCHDLRQNIQIIEHIPIGD